MALILRNNQVNLRKLIVGGVAGLLGATLASLFLMKLKTIQYKNTALKSGDHDPMIVSASSGKDSEELVVIFGWGGSTKRHLARIVEFYSKQLKRDVILYIQPMVDPQDPNRRFFQFFKDHVKLESRKQVVIHAFSQNGASTLGYLLEELRAPNQSEEQKRFASLFESKVHRLVFDSCPVEMEGSTHRSISGLTRAMTAIILGRAQYHHVVLSPALYLYILINHLSNPKVNRDFRQRVKNIRTFFKPESVSMLFLYSTKDQLIPYREVEGFIASATQQGFKTETLRFEDTAHIVHFRNHPEEYGTRVEKFIERNE